MLIVLSDMFRELLFLLATARIVYLLLRRHLSYSPHTILFGLYYLYFIGPNWAIRTISETYNWNFTQTTLVYTNAFVFIGFLFFFGLTFLNNPLRKVNEKETKSVSSTIFFIWFIFIFLLAKKALSADLSFALLQGKYLGSGTTSFKTLAYFSIPISILMFMWSGRYIAFLPAIGFVFIDISTGSRTTAFIALVPLLTTYLLIRERLPVISLLAVGVGFSFIEYLRSSVFGYKFNFNPFVTIGEVRETFVSLPLIIENFDTFRSEGFVSLLAHIFHQGLGPLRVLLSENTFTGEVIQQIAGRGYGLGSNMLTTPLVFGNLFLFAFLMQFFLILFSLIPFYLIRSKYELYVYFSIWIIVARLGMRESFIVNVSFILYLFAMYVVVRFLSKINFSLISHFKRIIHNRGGVN